MSTQKPIHPAYDIHGVFAVVVDERSHQDAKWGTIEEHPHEVGSWVLIMEKLIADARAAWAGNRGDSGALDEIRKAVAVGVACMEQHGVVHRCAAREATWNKNRPSPLPGAARAQGEE